MKHETPASAGAYPICYCGEIIFDVEEGIRTCGHFDDDPLNDESPAEARLATPKATRQDRAQGGA